MSEICELESEGKDCEDDTLDYKEWNGVDVMESLCMNCGENGQTRLMLHKIPYFRELIIASFACDNCGERNNEVTFGGEIQVEGCSFELKVTSTKDLDRQLIKSDSATVKIRELEFEIPPLTQKGEISTIEGILRTAAKNLALCQSERMDDDPHVGAKVADVIHKLTLMASGLLLPFHITVEDPAGNSFMQNLYAPQADPNMTTKYFFRTPEQDVSLGLQANKGVFRDDKESNFKALLNQNVFGSLKNENVDQKEGAAADSDSELVRLGRNEVISIPSQCPNCQCEGDSLTAVTDIPHFKEVIIMAFDCKSCGFRNNEVKGGGAVPTVGTEVRLLVTHPDDLKRDLLKSDSSLVLIPELELELGHGTLGGVFTTVEGLLTKIHRSLLENNPFAIGDSTVLHHSTDTDVIDTKTRFSLFMARLEELSLGKRFPFTVVLRDPLGNSFISAPLGSFLPPEMDANLTVLNFERTFEENEDLGLNDLNTADFETGVDHDSEILADRVTTTYVKGPDHPTLFAKGTEVCDDTQGGVCFVATEPEDLTMSSEEPYFCQPPAGWSVVKDVVTHTDNVVAADSIPTVSHRVFSDDSLLKYIPYEEFSGAKAGFVFRLGSKGIGYYEDSRSSTNSSSTNTTTGSEQNEIAR